MKSGWLGSVVGLLRSRMAGPCTLSTFTRLYSRAFFNNFLLGGGQMTKRDPISGEC